MKAALYKAPAFIASSVFKDIILAGISIGVNSNKSVCADKVFEQL